MSSIPNISRDHVLPLFKAGDSHIKYVFYHYSLALIVGSRFISFASLAAQSRITFLCIFPLGLFGTSSMNLTPPASCLCFATLSFIHSLMLSSVTDPFAASLRTTYARGSSSCSLQARQHLPSASPTVLCSTPRAAEVNSHLQRNNRSISHVLIFKQHSLQLRRRNLETLNFYELLLAIHNPVPTLLISYCHISRA